MATALVGLDSGWYGIVASTTAALKTALMAQPKCPGFLLSASVPPSLEIKNLGALTQLKVIEL